MRQLLLYTLLFCPVIMAAQDNCLLQSSLSSSPPPVEGLYPANTSIHFCYTIEQWDITGSIEWLHAVEIQFGDGWDLSSLQAEPPSSCGGDGIWEWYDSWTSCQSGRTFGPGFAYDSSSGLICGGFAYDDHPGNNWGDGQGICYNIGYTTPPRLFCWTINTLECSTDSSDLSLTVNPLSDGESGSWLQTGCNTAALDVYAYSSSCCANDLSINATPFYENTNGLRFDLEGTDTTHQYQLLLMDASNRLVASLYMEEASGQIDSLAAGTYTVILYDLNSRCSQRIEIEIKDCPPLEKIADPIICPGDTIALWVEELEAATYDWLPSDGLSCADCSMVFAHPDTSMSYGVSIAAANGCEYTATINVSVGELPNDILPDELFVCPNNETFSICLPTQASYIWQSPNGFVFNGDCLTLPNPTPSMIGQYNLYVRWSSGCQFTEQVSLSFDESACEE
jgi:hypothetical protein